MPKHGPDRRKLHRKGPSTEGTCAGKAQNTRNSSRKAQVLKECAQTRHRQKEITLAIQGPDTEGICTNKTQTQKNYAETALKQKEATPPEPTNTRNLHKHGLRTQRAST